MFSWIFWFIFIFVFVFILNKDQLSSLNHKIGKLFFVICVLNLSKSLLEQLFEIHH